ncbi:cupin domain-containing protein [Microvirga pudoricolor]|uniref:cupin domain-containing protein n=1 Tax=Microvirga pudoricolor TaxID=2778729 RepID=UPI0019526C37|nr:cupin domain-containing protein [Microvirga pudoricolor]MBM6592439.1 cupin domain-containing protein [Microvirga pudoricolor]
MTDARAYGERHAYNVPLGTETFVFADDGLIPNNKLPLIVKRRAMSPAASDRAKSLIATFAKNGWTGAWQNGIYDYHHYHSTAHEVLGLVSGSASVRFGGEGGDLVGLTAGDVVVIPAGVGHALINGTADLSVVGAYADGRECDLIRDDAGAIAGARQRIAAVPLPDADPIDGTDGPLMKLWS